ncbi:MAG: hypothetical protein AAFX87_16195 [Bacteroidota bacterium]
MFEIPINYIDIIFEMLSEKTGQPLDGAGFEKISEAINPRVAGDLGKREIDKRYLQEKMFKRSLKAKEKGVSFIRIQANKIDPIVQFLGFNNYLSFQNAQERPADRQLKSLIGTYFSYLRMNQKEGAIFRSPVEIYEMGTKVMLKLVGPERIYKGELSIENGCLFFVIKGDGGKQFHHVYRIGIADRPKVMQGVFSGVSSSFEPIGGRVVLIRDDRELKYMQNLKISLTEPSEEFNDLIHYFKDYSKNNLRINRVITLDVEDLRE